MIKIMTLFFILTIVRVSFAEEIKREDFLATQEYSKCASSLIDSEAHPKETDPQLQDYWQEKYNQDPRSNGFVDFGDAQANQSAKLAGVMEHRYNEVSFPGEQDGQRGIFKEVSWKQGLIFIPLPEGKGESVEFEEDVVLKKDSKGDVLQSEKMIKKYERFDLSDVEFETKIEGSVESVKAIRENESYPIVNFPSHQWREPYEARTSGVIHCVRAPCPQSEAMEKLTKKPWPNKGLLNVDKPDLQDGVKAKKMKIKAVAAKPEALSKSLAKTFDEFAETYVAQCTDTTDVDSAELFSLSERKDFPRAYNRHGSRNLVRGVSKSESCIKKLNTCKNVADSRVSQTVEAVISKIKQSQKKKQSPLTFVGENYETDGPRQSIEVNQSGRGTFYNRPSDHNISEQKNNSGGADR